MFFLQEAIENESFHGGRSVYWETGCIEEGFKMSKFSVDGTIRIGGQDHFYLETHCCLAIPVNENNEIEIVSATQSPNELQVRKDRRILINIYYLLKNVTFIKVINTTI